MKKTRAGQRVTLIEVLDEANLLWRTEDDRVINTDIFGNICPGYELDDDVIE